MDNKTKETVEPIAEQMSSETLASTERGTMQKNAAPNGGGAEGNQGNGSRG